MLFCPGCGHALGDAGAARFCPSCGRPTLDWRTDTAERPRVDPPAAAGARMPPQVAEAPLPARFPLYADEYAPWSAEPESPEAPAPASPAADDWFSRAAEVSHDHQDVTSALSGDDDGRSPTRWLVVTIAVVALIALGWWYLARQG